MDLFMGPVIKSWYSEMPGHLRIHSKIDRIVLLQMEPLQILVSYADSSIDMINTEQSSAAFSQHHGHTPAN